MAAMNIMAHKVWARAGRGTLLSAALFWSVAATPVFAETHGRVFGGVERGADAPRAGYHSELEQKVAVHSGSADARELIEFLAPRGWRVRFDVAPSKLNRRLVFHAETTRRRALDQLCLGLGLKGFFYPRKRLVLIAAGGSR